MSYRYLINQDKDILVPMNWVDEEIMFRAFSIPLAIDIAILESDGLLKRNKKGVLDVDIDILKNKIKDRYPLKEKTLKREVNWLKRNGYI